MIKNKIKEKSTFISRLSETFGVLEYSASERKVLQEAFFRFVQVGNLAYAQKWLDEKRVDILACDENGRNVLQIFCKNAGLDENRWKDKDFNPAKELSENQLYLYDILNTHYTIAITQKRMELIDTHKHQINQFFLRHQQILEQNKIGLLSVLCGFPRQYLEAWKNAFSSPKLSKRQISRKVSFVRKFLPTISLKKQRK